MRRIHTMVILGAVVLAAGTPAPALAVRGEHYVPFATDFARHAPPARFTPFVSDLGRAGPAVTPARAGVPAAAGDHAGSGRGPAAFAAAAAVVLAVAAVAARGATMAGRRIRRRASRSGAGTAA